MKDLTPKQRDWLLNWIDENAWKPTGYTFWMVTVDALRREITANTEPEDESQEEILCNYFVDDEFRETLKYYIDRTPDGAWLTLTRSFCPANTEPEDEKVKPHCGGYEWVPNTEPEDEPSRYQITREVLAEYIKDVNKQSKQKSWEESQAVGEFFMWLGKQQAITPTEEDVSQREAS